MRLAQLVADAQQAIAVGTAALGTAIGEGLVHGTWPSTAIGFLGVAAAVLAAVKIPPSPAAAARTLERAAKNSTYPKG